MSVFGWLSVSLLLSLTGCASSHPLSENKPIPLMTEKKTESIEKSNSSQAKIKPNKAEIKPSFEVVYSKKSFNPDERSSGPALIKEADALNGFALDLYKKLVSIKLIKKGENAFFSPFSVRFALALVLPATENGSTTQEQLSEVLRTSAPTSAKDLGLKTQLLNIKDSFKTATKEEGEFAIINQVFVEKSARIQEPYLSVVKENYNAGVAKLDFGSSDSAAKESQKVINDYVARVTGNMITNLLPDYSINTSTVSVLLNAIYMKLSWQNEFEKVATKPGDFNLDSGETIRVNMMRQQESFPYADEVNYQAMTRSYRGNSISMMIILPKPGIKIEQIENEISAEKIRKTTQKMALKDLTVTMPKFKMKWGTHSLRGALEAMGVRSVFEPRKLPHLLEAPRTPHIANVFHQATIEVNEGGTVAAAATAGVAVDTAADESEPINFTVNRPALFLILENSTKAILFMGRLGRPDAIRTF